MRAAFFDASSIPHVAAANEMQNVPQRSQPLRKWSAGGRAACAQTPWCLRNRL